MLHLDYMRPQVGCVRLQAVLHWVASIRNHWVANIGSQGSGTMRVTSSDGPVKEAWRDGAWREACTVKGGEIRALVGHQSTGIASTRRELSRVALSEQEGLWSCERL